MANTFDNIRNLSVNKTGSSYAISLDFNVLADALAYAQLALDTQASADLLERMPIASGNLRQETASLNASMIGTGELYLYPPTSDYGHYQWKGELYVDPITGKGAFYSPKYGFWSRPGVKKVPSGRPLIYQDPMARANWGAVAIEECGDKWLEIVKDALR